VGLDRVRQAGAGRTPSTLQSPTLLTDLEALMTPLSRGDTKSPLRWNCEGTAKLAALLRAQGHSVGPRLVARLLRQLGYSLQATRMPASGARTRDREEQFEYVNSQVDLFHRRSQPVIAISTTRKEAAPKDEPQPAGGSPAPGPSAEEPTTTEWVPHEPEQDTTSFVVAVLRYWWWHLGRPVYPEARELLIVADLAGARGKSGRAWKLALQHMADESGLTVNVCYFPPGTTRWLRAEQCVAAQLEIEVNARRVCMQTVARVIGSKSSAAGMFLRPEFEHSRQQLTLRSLESRVDSLLLEPAPFHGDWNYTIRAHATPPDSPAQSHTAS
jgi:hypothetical protein